MNFDNAARNLRVLLRANTIIADIRLRALATRASLYMFAAPVAAFGLLMLDLALYLALAELWSPVRAAATIGAGNVVLALVLVAIAARVKPGRDLDFAQEIHASAMDALAGDLRGAEAEVRAIVNVVRHPLDSALPALAIPLVTSLIRGFRKSGKE
ncbi:phage holin family protein [Azorhizobium sp. AG788]|uniref:phage holin family protein n=1 Tax=Azorhizobium sp. AG788 TaxID=2183897 RepID=UPI003138ECAB